MFGFTWITASQALASSTHLWIPIFNSSNGGLVTWPENHPLWSASAGFFWADRAVFRPCHCRGVCCLGLLWAQTIFPKQNLSKCLSKGELGLSFCPEPWEKNEELIRKISLFQEAPFPNCSQRLLDLRTESTGTLLPQ